MVSSYLWSKSTLLNSFGAGIGGLSHSLVLSKKNPSLVTTACPY